MTNAISFDHVSKRYKAVAAVTDLTFDIPAGSVTALLGPNGAGKTTTISMMLGLTRPTQGTVRLLGGDPSIAASRTNVGAMLQSISMPDKVSVEEVIGLFRNYYPNPLPTASLLKLSGLEKEAKSLARKLSGGQQRRLQFALAMAGDPRVLFLDEPTTGMDVESRRLFWEQLQTFAQREGRTILLTTHHLEEADSIADRIILMHRGKRIADASPNELKAMTGARFISCMAGSGLQAEALNRLPDVLDVEFSGRHIRLRTSNSDATLRALFLQSLDVYDIEVTAGGLEDAFIALTKDAEEVLAR